MKVNLRILTSTAFLIGLILLLLNDFVFKGLYGNWITGKLSDFAGLFIFPLFWTAFFPKFKKHIFISIALIFLWWKSPFSGSFIHFCNEFLAYPIARVVDYTDLLALFILPIAYYYNPKSFLKINPVGLALVSAFAFAATSRSWPMVDFYEYPIQPVVAWYKLPDTSTLVQRQANNIQLIKSDSIQGYYSYETWGEDLIISEFNGLFLIRANALSLEGSVPFRDDDFEKIKTKSTLSERILPIVRQEIQLSEWEYFKTVDSLCLKTSCFGVEEEMCFKNSILHGPYQQFYDSGELRLKGEFINGLENGVWITFGKQGDVEREVTFKMGERTFDVYYINGKVHQKERFYLRSQFVNNNYFSFLVVGILSMIFLLGALFYNKIPFTTKEAPTSKKTTFGKILAYSILPIMGAKFIQMLIPVLHAEWSFNGVPILLFQFAFSILILIVFKLFHQPTHRGLMVAVFFVFLYLAVEQWLFLLKFLI
jgi:hypothetical protein